MPAKRKYLSNRLNRFLKITAAIFGGYFVAAGFHLALTVIPGWRNAVLLTSTYSLFLLWAVLMIFAFLGRNGFKIWGLYLGLGLLFFLLTHLFKNP
ncbi:hypothetical protein LAG90_18185 [Marinilongibacter aquaticus]|uniref:hypothetical protein n=1 Tax=Marinilongibacter aquaticus TaxID=2975157 RepID=UPI0021BD9496|nr:hypothetical protein [Marinilongibacter aquaticus]UBM58732.1 hypothetical protein LAG90_18185 [Marinilongibacter aquaticus]